MFKVGDRVVCINDWVDDYSVFIHGEEVKLKKFKIYIICSFSDGKYSTVLLENHINYSYSSDRFILLKEYRKQKLKKICSKKEIR